MKIISAFPDVRAPRIVRLVFLADVTALPILGWFCYSAIGQFNPEKAYWGQRYAKAIVMQCFFTTLLLLFATLFLLAFSNEARRIWSFPVFIAASIAMLILWRPVVG